MAWIILIIIILALLLLYGTRRKSTQKEAEAEAYVCDICGETECICHKDHIDRQA